MKKYFQSQLYHNNKSRKFKNNASLPLKSENHVMFEVDRRLKNLIVKISRIRISLSVYYYIF
jgi:hypothetical protein